MRFSLALRLWLTVPVVIAIATWIVAWVYYSPRSFVVLLASVVISLMGLVELIVVSFALVRLVEERRLRTRENFVFTGIGSLPALHLVFWVVLGLVNMALRNEA